MKIRTRNEWIPFLKACFLFLAFCYGGRAFAQTNWGTIEFTNKYGESVTGQVVKVEVARVVYKTSNTSFGAARLADLPTDLQKRFHYDPEAERIADLDEKEKKARLRELQQAIADQAFQKTLAPDPPILETVDVIEATSKVTEQNDTWWRWSYKVKVRNNSSDRLTKFLRLQYLDSEGYEIEHTLVEIKVAPLETKTVTGSILIDVPKTQRVKSVHSHWDD